MAAALVYNNVKSGCADQHIHLIQTFLPQLVFIQFISIEKKIPLIRPGKPVILPWQTGHSSMAKATLFPVLVAFSTRSAVAFCSE